MPLARDRVQEQVRAVQAAFHRRRPSVGGRRQAEAEAQEAEEEAEEEAQKEQEGEGPAAGFPFRCRIATQAPYSKAPPRMPQAATSPSPARPGTRTVSGPRPRCFRGAPLFLRSTRARLAASVRAPSRWREAQTEEPWHRTPSG